jgi:SAM-dependent methyltransferase
MEISLLNIARRIFPVETRRKIIKLTRWPPVGLVRFGSFRRLKPISPNWGSERGQPIDRYYIENFLQKNSEDICGRVLEIGDNTYTGKFGGDRVLQSDVLHVAENKPDVTIIEDISNAEHVPSGTFDCIILTQTLQTIFNLTDVIRTLCRILKPGGVVLVTIPGISKISRYDMDRWGYHWSFTTMSARRLFESAFPEEAVQVEAFGNVLVSVAFLHGLAVEELSLKELDFVDPDYQLLITVRAQKPGHAE